MGRSDRTARRSTLAATMLLVLIVGTAGARDEVERAPTDAWVAEQRLRQARFLFDTGDTLGGRERLPDPDARLEDPRARWQAQAWWRWAAWALGDTTTRAHPPEDEGDTRIEAALRALDLLRPGDILDPEVEGDDQTLLLAARFLRAGRTQEVVDLLEDRSVDDDLRALRSHLLAGAHLARGDSNRAAIAYEEILDTKAPLEMRADAALHLAAREATAGRSPRTWLEEVPTESRLAPRAGLMLALSDVDSVRRRHRLEEWIAEHPKHPLRREALLWRASWDMDSRRFAPALRTYEQLHALDRQRIEEMGHLLADSTDQTALLRRVWDRDPLWRLRPSTVHALGSALAEHLFGPGEIELSIRPMLEDLVLGARGESSTSRARPTASERRRERELRVQRDQAELDWRQARRRWQEAERENRRRAGYRERGRTEGEEVLLRLATADTTLDRLDERSERARELLRAAREQSLSRLDARVGELELLLEENLDRADRIELLYLDGPMARREDPASPEVPLPRQLVGNERELHRELRDHLHRLRARTVERIEGSTDEGLRHRLFASLDSLLDRHRALTERGERLVADIDSARVALARRPAYRQARAAFELATARWENARSRWHSHRVEVARERMEEALRASRSGAQASLYGRATAAMELGRDDTTPEGAELRARARRDFATLLERHGDSPLRGDVRFRLADLELTRAREDFQERMRSFLDDGEGGTDRSLAPLLDIEPAVTLYERILAEDPDFPRRDLVLFHLGMLRADAGLASGEQDLTRLVEVHPESPLVQEAQLRLGEMAFERRDWPEAIDRLRAATGGPSLPTRVVALYKLGWSHYAVDEFDAASTAFLDLLDLHADPTTPAEAGFDLAGESRDLLVRSLARAGGSAAFEEHLDARGRRDYESGVLLELSALLGEYALDPQRREADETFLRRYGEHPEALEVARRLVRPDPMDDDRTDGDALARAEERWSIASRFLAGSDWSGAQHDSTLAAEGDRLARETLEDIALRTHHRARQRAARPLWRKSRERYAALLDHWPAHSLSPRWQLLRGECSRELGEHATAVDAFTAAARSDSLELARTASWQALASVDRWYESTRPDAGAADSLGAAAGADSLARRFEALAARFDRRFPDDSRRADLHWRVAVRGRVHGWWEEAADRFDRFARLFPGDERHLLALRRRAEILYQAEAFDRAASAFAEAHRRALARGEQEAATELLPWIAHCELKWAEAVMADPERGPREAAPLWEKVAERWPEHEHAPHALYQAGQAHASSGDLGSARANWSRLIDRHPEHELAIDAYRSLAGSHEEQEEWADAATVLRAYAAAHPDLADAGDALLRAADFFELAGDDGERERTLDTYLELHPDDTRTLAAVLHRRARTELDGLGSTASVASLVDPEAAAASAVRRLLDLRADHPDLVDPSLVARVEFLQAEEIGRSFHELRLTQPLDRSLAAKKKALEDLLAAYRGCADRKVAPWAQAAAFRIGEALVELGDALRESERPADLQGDDLLAYEEVLDEQAFAFYDRGEEVWRTLLKTGPEGSEDAVLAEWLDRTRDRLFPRVARRFLHKPSFDYPLVEATVPEGAAR